MDTEGVLIQYEIMEKEIYNCSGLMLKNSFVLTTGTCLAPFVQKCINNNQIVNVDSLNQLLKTSIKYEKNIIIKNDSNKVKLNGIEKINIFQTNGRNLKEYHVKSAKILKIFHCNLIDSVIDRSLPDWEINNIKEYKMEIVKEFLLSIIIIIKLDEGGAEDVDLVLKELFAKLVPINYLERGDVVFLETTPFGNDTFLNSYSEGIVATTVGVDQCLFLTDASAAPGSEGGPIFLKVNNRNKKNERIVVGLVLSSVSFWKDEWCGFTLGVTLATILQQLILAPNPIDEILFEKPTKYFRPEIVDNSILKIFCGGSHGTGILLDTKKGIIVTTAHTVKCSPDVNIFGKWRNEIIKLELLYKTPENVPYDIAVLRTKSSILKKMEAIKFATSSPRQGETVLAFGYPFEIRSSKNNLPTVSRGSVAKTSECMLQTTCCIQSGASGGAIVRPNGELLGIIVCITANNQTQTSYPHVNMAVPAHLVQIPLDYYLKSGDISVFKKYLESNENHVRKVWNLFSSHL